MLLKALIFKDLPSFMEYRHNIKEYNHNLIKTNNKKKLSKFLSYLAVKYLNYLILCILEIPL